ncbi:MAG: TIGR00282 family metallophosphoesterase [Dehalococcoidia bacterium]
MRILMIGDVIGKPGRKAIRELVPQLRQEHQLDMIIANAENAAGGMGLTPETALELVDAGVDVLTSGNHIWQYKEIVPALEDGHLPLLRPLNYPPQAPGRGYLLTGQVMVVNLVGRTFMNSLDCPFRTVEALLEGLGDKAPKVIIVDFHAEATSEKLALGWFLNGKVSAVLGTHTHVGTVDLRILPGGTAYVTDVGMTGPVDSVIGVEVEAVLERFITRIPQQLPIGKGRVGLDAILVEVDEATGKARSVSRLRQELG